MLGQTNVNSRSCVEPKLKFYQIRCHCLILILKYYAPKLTFKFNLFIDMGRDWCPTDYFQKNRVFKGIAQWCNVNGVMSETGLMSG